MSDVPNTPDESQVDESKKTFDYEYVASLRREAAEYRTKAKDNAEAAAELAQIKEANRTEAEKQADRVAELEKANLKATNEVLRFRIAAKHGISDEDADLFLTGTDEESLTKQAERLATKEPAKKRGSYVPNEGTNPNPEGTGHPMRDVARNIFNPSA